ncbi:MAG: nuclear transport factor 2 family protein [Bacteroidota bacterium]
MKKTILLASFLLTAFFSLMAQDSDYQAVVQTVNYYLEGGTNNDFETLKKAFHETASMKYIGDGYTEVNALEFFGKVMKPGPKQNRQTRIASIDVSGIAANAKLEIEYPTFTFIDYMNLLKIDGEWKIVSKIFYKRMKEEKG